MGRGGSGLDKLRSLGVSAEVEGRQGANSGGLSKDSIPFFPFPFPFPFPPQSLHIVRFPRRPF